MFKAISLVKNLQLFFVILILIVTLGISEFNYSYGEPNENKRQPAAQDRYVGASEYSQKIHPRILQIMNNTSPELMARSFGATYQNDELDVYVYLNSEFVNNIPRGLNVLTQDDNIIFTRLTFDQIQTLSDLESVDSIGLPHKAFTRSHVDSEGVAWSFADDMQAAGFTGNGITVAVIDVSFDTSNTEISGNIVSGGALFQTGCGNMLCGDTVGFSHGTAVAEAVVDMAPNVNLRVYAILNSIGVNAAIDDAIANGVDIITISLGFPTAGGDGVTGQYRDGTSSNAKKVDDAKTAGVLVTISAGNQGLSHWSGTYSASPVTPSSIGLGAYQSVMNFRPAQSEAQRACLPVQDIGDPYIAAWDDWASTNQNYDLFLFNAAMSLIFDSSVDVQDGIGLDPPVEEIGAAGPFAEATQCIVLASLSSTQNHFFHIDTEENKITNSADLVRAGSLDTPADSAGSLTVGAINQATDVLEAFSSSGPTDDGRDKPEICGPDNTISTQNAGSGLNPFFGTSVATPHVAGAAALLLEKNPGLTVDQLRQKLINESRFNASYSVDNLCGSNSGALSLSIAAVDTGKISSDFNNDGFDDMAVGNPGKDVFGHADAGTVSVIYGSASRLSASNSQQWYLDSPGIVGKARTGVGITEQFGRSLGVGDFNNDGFNDMAVGNPGKDVFGHADAGTVSAI